MPVVFDSGLAEIQDIHWIIGEANVAEVLCCGCPELHLMARFSRNALDWQKQWCWESPKVRLIYAEVLMRLHPERDAWVWPLHARSYRILHLLVSDWIIWSIPGYVTTLRVVLSLHKPYSGAVPRFLHPEPSRRRWQHLVNCERLATYSS